MVTDAKLKYKGSITIDADLVEAAGLFEGQLVFVNNTRNNGQDIHWETYVMKGEGGKGEIILNGPPAHLFKKGDVVIILGYVLVDLTEAKDVHPTTVHVDENNKITSIEKGNI